MRSLALKLTLAFLFVGLIGAILVAAIVSQSTGRAFDQFMRERNEAAIVTTLASYYQTQGSWEGVEKVFDSAGSFHSQTPNQGGKRGGAFSQAPFVLVSTDRVIVYSKNVENLGREVSQNELEEAVPIDVNGDVVGWLLWTGGKQPLGMNTPESLFLANVNKAIIWSALGAVIVALVLGGVLAYSLTRQLRELTAATKKVAAGELGYQVEVRSQDEVGELALSFNQMSADLERSNQIRKQMTADIAHDLRSPLSVILGYTEALSDNKIEGSPEVFNIMYQEAVQLSHLIEDLRTLSLADAGELALNLQAITPYELMEDIVRAYQHQAEMKKIALTIDAEENLPRIRIDPNRMTQIFSNLLSNALRYTAQGGEIILGGYTKKGMTILFVKDNGTGIDSADLPHIFNRFYRSDQARQQNGETGLGLAIAKSLVEAQGGTIWVESQFGEGTTFYMRFPVTDSA